MDVVLPLSFFGLVRGHVYPTLIDGVESPLGMLVPSWLGPGQTVYVQKEKVRTLGDEGKRQALVPRQAVHDSYRKYVVDSFELGTVHLRSPSKAPAPKAPPPPSEATVVVNGVTLTPAQVRFLRVAVESHRPPVTEEGSLAHKLAESYRDRAVEILVLLEQTP